MYYKISHTSLVQVFVNGAVNPSDLIKFGIANLPSVWPVSQCVCVTVILLREIKRVHTVVENNQNVWQAVPQSHIIMLMLHIPYHAAILFPFCCSMEITRSGDYEEPIILPSSVDNHQSLFAELQEITEGFEPGPMRGDYHVYCISRL